MTPEAGPAGADAQPSCSLVIATYRRPEMLPRCLAGVEALDPGPDEVIVVCRSDDDRSVQLARGGDRRVVTVQRPGQVAALFTGAAVAHGDVIAFLDDDAIPQPYWLGRLLAHFADPHVMAAGGRDVVHHGDAVVVGAEPVVGRLGRWGRPIGNHHIGTGEARPVDFIKGSNCAYRAGHYGAPRGLRGSGAEVANDMASSLALSSDGFGVIYDPAAVVDHHPAERFDGDLRGAPTRAARMDATYNEAYVVLSLRPADRWRCIGYRVLVGHQASPGLVRAAVGVLRRDVVASDLPGTLREVGRAARDARRHPLRLQRPQRRPAPAPDGG